MKWKWKQFADFITSKEWNAEALMRNSLEPYLLQFIFNAKTMSDVAVSQTVKNLNCIKSLSEELITRNLHIIVAGPMYKHHHKVHMI
jgi:hypothetical protein